MRKNLNKMLPKVYGRYFNLLARVSPKKAAEKAFYVFCTVRKGRVLPNQKEYLDQAKNGTINVQGHTLQTYAWPGNKETVLLVHGWESNTFRWRNLIAKLREADYNIVAFDAPAHGYSSGQYLNLPLYSDGVQAMIEKYDPKYLIGHSMGGMTLMYNEFHHQNAHVEKMVTIGSPSEFYEIMDHYQKLLNFNDKVRKALEAFVLDRFGFTVNEFSSSRFAKKNTKKGLLLHDELDKLAPFHASEAVHAQWKGSTFIRTKGLGHSMHQEHVNDQIVDFLKN
ncbi:alpha/beta fold hydrolase [Zobellia uliginosa]|uniref:alpha/beta fold hydrolase n=1 Tax=Zobellia uliginosa TaxID=143224 RepID=UPI0026E2644C|nr:alpha/beta hydrolase [Zobellia uliginosa]MDO6517661.1 alpha/beta hydrolase [Zobellia uliginosa]